MVPIQSQKALRRMRCALCALRFISLSPRLSLPKYRFSRWVSILFSESSNLCQNMWDSPVSGAKGFPYSSSTSLHTMGFPV